MECQCGLIGQGNIGYEIALKLKQQNFLHAVYDIKKHVALKNFHTPLEKLAKSCNLFILCLPSPTAVKNTVKQLVAHQCSGIILDLSTSDSETVIHNVKQCHDTLAYIEAPITGGVRAVRNGSVRLILAGNPKIIQLIKPILQAFSAGFVYFKEYGQPSKMKLIHNMVTIANSHIAIEALMLGKLLGLDPQMMFDVIETGTASSYVIKNTLKRTVLNKQYIEGFKLALAHKDAMLIKNIAEKLNVKLPIFTEVKNILSQAMQEKEHQEMDYPIVINEIAKQMGVFNKSNINYLDQITVMY